MCGIAGFIDYKFSSSQEILFKMADSINYRGPDDQGIYFQNRANYQIGLSHRRLSILDLNSRARQPMSYRHLTICYNGEIYNYKEIKKELRSLGHEFATESDTEVILHAFDQWGILAVQHFIGMFAIVIFDHSKQQLLMIRDRAGVKPLYYFHHDGLILFASELKPFHNHPSFHAELNLDALALYFQYGHILTPHCIYQYCRKLQPGNFLRIDLNRSTQFCEEAYWEIDRVYEQEKLNIDFEEAVQETERLLVSAFQYRMVSDVPVGVFLSGGYDSNAVAGILQKNSGSKLNTFTIGFENTAYNEANYAKDIADYLGTEHTEYYCSEKQAQDIITILPEVYDEPFADSSAIPTLLVSQIAKESVTVALSADGGDEVFGGYTKYINALKHYNTINKIPMVLRGPTAFCLNKIPSKYIESFGDYFRFDHKIKTVKTLLNTKNDPVLLLKLMSQRLNSDELSLLFKEEVRELPTYFDNFNNTVNSPLSRLQAIDYKTYLLDDILTKVDRATMSYSLEGREPFLDHRIIEFVSKLPDQFKVSNGDSKVILKTIVHKYIPRNMLDRPKQGFGIPIQNWFRRELKHLFDESLQSDLLESQGIFNVNFIKEKLNHYYLGHNDYFRFLWFMYCFQLWYKRWFDR